MFSNKQLRQGSRVGSELESVCCFKKMLSDLTLFNGNSEGRFDVCHSEMQSWGSVVQVGHGGKLIGNALQDSLNTFLCM